MVQKPDEDTTPDDYRKRSAFTCAAVYADESVRGQESALRACHIALKAAIRSREDMLEENWGGSLLAQAPIVQTTKGGAA